MADSLVTVLLLLLLFRQPRRLAHGRTLLRCTFTHNPFTLTRAARGRRPLRCAPSLCQLLAKERLIGLSWSVCRVRLE